MPLRAGRGRTLGFGLLFAAVAYLQPVAYRRSYPTRSDRVGFARSFGDDKAIRLFYGVPHDLLSVAGYTAWRVGGILTLFAGIWAVVAATGALRGEEESGRCELVLSHPVDRRSMYGSGLAAIALDGGVLWMVLWLSLIAAGLPDGGSAFLSAAVISVAAVFAAGGALASQLVNTRRGATRLATGVLALMYGLRIIADTVSGAGWMRWLSPLGWAEQMRPFAGARAVVLLAPAATAAVLLGTTIRLLRNRDIGVGLLAGSGRRAPRLTLLGSPARFALRCELSSLGAWATATAAFAFLLGAISHSVSSAGLPASLRRELAKAGAGSIATSVGYLSFVFLFFLLAVSVFGVSQVAAARAEELSGRSETMLSQPIGRARWLTARLGVAIVSAAGISLIAGLGTWAGARAAGVPPSVWQLALAGANCLAVAVLFLGLGALLYVLSPNGGAALAYAAVTAAFIWQLFGSLLGAPRWVTDLTPFAHVGLVPEQPFRTAWALAMVLGGVACNAVALLLFDRRDLGA